MDTKLCKRCKQEKLIEKFTAHASTKDRLQTWCKDCCNEIRRIARAEKKGYYATERERYREKHLVSCKRLYYKKRKQVIEHYCPDGGKCVKCGFNDIRALSVDHINGGGSKHRKELNGVSIYKWLVDNDFPPGFQILCMNCQFIKRYEENGYQTQ